MMEKIICYIYDNLTELLTLITLIVTVVSLFYTIRNNRKIFFEANKGTPNVFVYSVPTYDKIRTILTLENCGNSSISISDVRWLSGNITKNDTIPYRETDLSDESSILVELKDVHLSNNSSYKFELDVDEIDCETKFVLEIKYITLGKKISDKIHFTIPKSSQIRGSTKTNQKFNFEKSLYDKMSEIAEYLSRNNR